MTQQTALNARFSEQDVDIQRQETVYQAFFRVEKYWLRHQLFAGGWSEPLERELFVRDDAVFVLLYDPWQDQVALVEQFRIGALGDAISPWLIELVAGMMEPGETEIDVAKREAAEEAGAKILDIVPVTHYHVSPGGSHEYVHVYCAKVDASQLGGYHGLAEEGEDIRVITINRQDAYSAVLEGRINNAATIIALQWLELHWGELQSRWLAESTD